MQQAPVELTCLQQRVCSIHWSKFPEECDGNHMFERFTKMVFSLTHVRSSWLANCGLLLKSLQKLIVEPSKQAEVCTSAWKKQLSWQSSSWFVWVFCFVFVLGGLFWVFCCCCCLVGWWLLLLFCVCVCICFFVCCHSFYICSCVFVLFSILSSLLHIQCCWHYHYIIKWSNS